MQGFIQGLIFFFLASRALAAGPACPAAAVVGAQVKECADNLALPRAGKACLEDFERRVDAQKARVATALSGLAAGGSQGRGLGDANAGYETTLKELTALAEQGNALSAQVEGYKGQLAWPEEAGSAAESGVPAQDFFAAHPCYADAKKLVLRYSRLLAQQARQLELTAQISAELAKKARKGEGSLRAEELRPLLDSAPRKGQGAPRPAPKQNAGKSDITGTEKNKKK